MLSRLHAGQRFWLAFTTVFFVSAIVLTVVAWPKSDPLVVADLRAPECAEWRELPAGKILDVYPNPGEKCFALRLFLADEKASVRSESEYDSYLAGQRASTAMRIFGWWAIFCFGFYALGWAGVRFGRKLWPGGGRKAA